MNRANIASGPSNPSSSTNVYNAITGQGSLQFVSTNTGSCVTSSNIWITNLVASLGTNQTVNVTFTIAGGSNNLAYDVFATGALAYPITNAVWAWMGQGYHCSTYTLAVQSNSMAYFILGKPVDADGDGLS